MNTEAPAPRRRWLKRTLVIALLIVAAPLSAALFMKQAFTIEKQVVIRRPQAEVFDFVKRLRNQEQYSVWAKRDPHAKREYRGEDGTVGAIASWDSVNRDVGIGEQEITKITDGQRIDVEIRMREPFASKDPAWTTVDRVSDDETRVTNGYAGKLRWPLNLLCPVVEETVGKDMQANLDALKSLLEKPGA